jgi:hypothetical protein
VSQGSPAAGSFAFTAELDALFERGFPHLFVLSEKERKGADRRQVARALEAVDPVLPVFVSPGTANRFLRAYAVGPTTRTTLAGIETLPERVEARQAALDDPTPIGLETLDTILAAQLPHGEETYAWRLQQAIFLAEAVLGSEPVAACLADHLLRAGRDPGAWGHRANPNQQALSHAVAAVRIFGTLRWRLAPSIWEALVRRLNELDMPELEVFTSLLRAWLSDVAPAPGSTHDTIELAVQQRDRDRVRRLLADRPGLWPDPQACYVGGPEVLDGRSFNQLPRLPRWQQRRMLDEHGTIRDPVIVRLVAWLFSGRAVRKEAGDWLIAHTEFAQPSLEDLAATGEDEAVVGGALAHLTGEAPPVSRPPSRASLGRELKALLGGLETRLLEAGDDEAAERAILAETFARYCENRAAAGETSPADYFTHALPDFSAPTETVERWLRLAVEVTDVA